MSLSSVNNWKKAFWAKNVPQNTKYGGHWGLKPLDWPLKALTTQFRGLWKNIWNCKQFKMVEMCACLHYNCSPTCFVLFHQCCFISSVHNHNQSISFFSRFCQSIDKYLVLFCLLPNHRPPLSKKTHSCHWGSQCAISYTIHVIALCFNFLYKSTSYQATANGCLHLANLTI